MVLFLYEATLVVSFTTFIFVLVVIYLMYSLADKVKKMEKMIACPPYLSLDDEITNAFAKRSIHVDRYSVKKKAKTKDTFIWTVEATGEGGKDE